MIASRRGHDTWVDELQVREEFGELVVAAGEGVGLAVLEHGPVSGDLFRGAVVQGEVGCGEVTSGWEGPVARPCNKKFDEQ